MSKNLSPLWRDPVLCFLLASGSLTVMAGAAIAPILPELIEHLHLSREWAGSLASAHYLTLALFSPILGVLADRVGQLRLLIPCLIGFAVAGIAGAWLPNYLTLLIDRGVLGVTSGGIAAASLGLMSRRYSGEARHQAISYAATIITLANIVYPLLAVGLGQFHWRFAFGLYGFSAILAGFALLWRIPLTKVSSPPTAVDASMSLKPLELLQSAACLRLFVSLSLISAIVYGTIVYLPIYLKTVLQSDLVWNGVILAVQAIGAALSSGLLIGPLTRRLGSLQVAALSLGVMALFLALFPHLSQLWLLMLASSLFGMTFGLVTPSLYNVLANLAPPHLQSSILATGIGSGFLGQFVSPWGLGPIWHYAGLTQVFNVCAVAAIAVGLLLQIPLKPPSGLPATPSAPIETDDLR